MLNEMVHPTFARAVLPPFRVWVDVRLRVDLDSDVSSRCPDDFPIVLEFPTRSWLPFWVRFDVLDWFPVEVRFCVELDTDS